MTGTEERALAALTGLAIGDALGMPTQALPRREILARNGHLTGFLPGPPDQPIAPGRPAGTVTDDTDQAMLVARLLVENNGRIDPNRLATELIAWEQKMREQGSLDLLGPSTKAAVAAIAAGESIENAGRTGTTNGAAMRITPVGIVCPATDLTALVDRVVDASMVTHNTSVALAGASAVAAAVSTGVAGGTLAEAVANAALAAEQGAERGHWVASADVAARIRFAGIAIEGLTEDEAAERIYRLIGTSVATQESVPAAFAVLAKWPDDPWQACLLAASLGGDTDTIAAIVGAVAGACHGAGAFPEHAVRTVQAVNDLPLAQLAKDLAALRAHG
jgi:ADP-ribosylglycohydrolase